MASSVSAVAADDRRSRPEQPLPRVARHQSEPARLRPTTPATITDRPVPATSARIAMERKTAGIASTIPSGRFSSKRERRAVAVRREPLPRPIASSHGRTPPESSGPRHDGRGGSEHLDRQPAARPVGRIEAPGDVGAQHGSGVRRGRGDGRHEHRADQAARRARGEARPAARTAAGAAPAAAVAAQPERRAHARPAPAAARLGARRRARGHGADRGAHVRGLVLLLLGVVDLRTDVLVTGGGLGGVAAALAAADRDARVVRSEETDWLGGQLTSQAVPLDEHPWIEDFGCTARYRALREAIREHYRRHTPLTAAARARPDLNPGAATVSRLSCEPGPALAVIDALVDRPEIEVLREHAPVAAHTDCDRITARSEEHTSELQSPDHLVCR